jgi:putative transcriptional regulator
MFDKCFLLNKVVKILENNEFEVYTTYGCFDIAAKRENVLLIKVLVNADGLNKEQASSLQATSHFLSAYPFVIAMKNNREFLEDKIVYSRFDLPVVTPKLFEEMMTDDIKAIQSAKGRHTEEINCFALREKRKEIGYTLEQLGKIVGISKKALYEIENKRVNPTEETVRKLEVQLNINLGMPFEMKPGKVVYLRPKNEFQQKVSREFVRIGLDNSSVYSSPFEIVGKESFSVITKPLQDSEKEIQTIKRLSKMFSSIAVFIAKRSSEKSIEGVPILLEEELPEIRSSHELVKIIEEKTA